MAPPVYQGAPLAGDILSLLTPLGFELWAVEPAALEISAARQMSSYGWYSQAIRIKSYATTKPR